MEAKILELFALMFSDVTTVSRGVRKRQLTSGDKARLHMARDLLTADLENPPSISEVARASGLSENKLKWGFREVFGQPPYAYLSQPSGLNHRGWNEQAGSRIYYISVKFKIHNAITCNFVL